MTYEEFVALVEQKCIGKRISASNKEDTEEFFGDEDFSEYEYLFSDDLEKLG
ncbi:antitoxin [Streptococcus dysgalactiae]|uniref:antitoxin n=1 Tax=Streptococcus dysgalactiae TaxID=1334 RepID=UPI0010DDEAA0|nr:antitoxin [Streptococcus dysgalactiae]VTS19856.1 addiction module antitoxin [Streptococcus dysgalactiae subsp. equisimilis]VTS44852.1 addiction module antitoxin [Streptococcus dysgalactiae subsp. equisimilis]